MFYQVTSLKQVTPAEDLLSWVRTLLGVQGWVLLANVPLGDCAHPSYRVTTSSQKTLFQFSMVMLN